MLTRDHELRVRQLEAECRNIRQRQAGQSRMMLLYSQQYVVSATGMTFQQVFGLLAVLLEVGTRRKCSRGHTKLLSRSPEIRIHRLERSSLCDGSLTTSGGHCPYRGLDAPCARCAVYGHER